jgi:hypothetical protein
VGKGGGAEGKRDFHERGKTLLLLFSPLEISASFHAGVITAGSLLFPLSSFLFPLSSFARPFRSIFFLLVLAPTCKVPSRIVRRLRSPTIPSTPTPTPISA